MKKRNLIFASLALILTLAIVAVFVTLPKAGNLITKGGETNTSSCNTVSLTEKPTRQTQTIQPAKTTETTQPTTEKPQVNTAEYVYQMGNTADGTITLGFTGDINLDETWQSGPMQYYKNNKNGISDFINPDLIKKMKDADILFVNNEFTYSTRGDEQLEKAYTFRANPENVQILKTLGVDVVSIANNHIYDFRKDAMADTMSTLKKANIAYVGGGENLADAMKPAYFKINDKTIAYVAASTTLWYYRTPAAGKNTMGILDAFSSDCIEAIKEAATNSDYVVVYLHWGDDYNYSANSEQISDAKKYIDAGADAVIGAHPHVLQGMDFYKGKFIAYSLGNFWFNMKDYQTGFLELVIDKTGKIEPHFTPCRQVGGKTYIENDKTTRNSIINIIENYSPNKNIEIDVNGMVSEK